MWSFLSDFLLAINLSIIEVDIICFWLSGFLSMDEIIVINSKVYDANLNSNLYVN